jgi:hypothetical protein
MYQKQPYLNTMYTRWNLLTVAIFLMLVAAPRHSMAGDPNAARIARFDRGSSRINVSRYPSVIQQDYRVFSNKCSQCHKLSRPINSDFALPEEWSRYIKRMMHKPGSGISGRDGRQIYEFLVYDSSVRKKAMLNAKLDRLPAREKAEQEKKIAEVDAAAH